MKTKTSPIPRVGLIPTAYLSHHEAAVGPRARQIMNTHTRRNKPKKLINLESRDCRWPIGDRGTLISASACVLQLPSYPYCKRHCRIAFHPAKPGGIRRSSLFHHGRRKPRSSRRHAGFSPSVRNSTDIPVGSGGRDCKLQLTVCPSLGRWPGGFSLSEAALER
jgi:hypothetical protein